MSHWRKSPFPLDGKQKTSWPILPRPEDPFRGIEAVLEIASYENYRQRAKGEVLTNDNFIRQDSLFLSQYSKLLKPGMSIVNIKDTASKLQLNMNPFLENSAPKIATTDISNQLLADIAEDLLPDIGCYATERVFGPMASEARECKVLAGAILSTSPYLEQGVTTAGRTCSRKPKPSVDKSHSIMAISKTPVMFWKIFSNRTVKPMLPLSSSYCPLQPISCLPDSSHMIARMVFTNNGPKPYFVLPIPELNVDILYARLWLEWLRVQRHSSNIYWEDLLRYRSELLYRSSCEQLFHNKEVSRCYSPSFFWD